ncbi:MAG TPA: thioredoxin family protein [Streptosporangiaceae bacterium]
MTAGVIAVVAALLVATAFGLYWKARNGRMVAQPAAGAASDLEAVLAKPRPAGQRASGSAGEGLSAEDIGADLGSRATLVQFSSAFCAPCRATRRILADVAELVDGVSHVEIDAESRLDLVRRLDVRRTPTTFVLGPEGQVTHRASGQPRKADVIAALGAVV